MNNIQSIEDFFVSHTGAISLSGLALNILLTAVLCSALGWFYIRFGTTLSNRRSLAKNFVLVGVTTTLVITVVKASLALSLGLVGALSIVRFRAAIKEPEELAFLFLTIGIGLGFGADQRLITIVAFLMIVASYLGYQRFYTIGKTSENFVLTINSGAVDGETLAQIVSILEEGCSRAVLKRYEKRDQDEEAVFLVEIQDFPALEEIKKQLEAVPGNPNFAFVEDIRVI